MPFKKLSKKLAQANSMDKDYMLKQRLFEALKSSVQTPGAEKAPDVLEEAFEEATQLEEGLKAQLDELFPTQTRANSAFSDMLAETAVTAPQTEVQQTDFQEQEEESQNRIDNVYSDDHDQTGGSMTDLTGYKDLSKAPLSFGDDVESGSPTSTFTLPTRSEEQRAASHSGSASFGDIGGDVDTEFSGNVKTLIRLVNELPEDVTKQTGAQIIRLTMEAMGISMEDVLTEAQSAQSEMLDAVRANIKKIEEYKTVIRKLETDIKYYQGKANELSEIIDLFILSNSSASDDD